MNFAQFVYIYVSMYGCIYVGMHISPKIFNAASLGSISYLIC